MENEVLVRRLFDEVFNTGSAEAAAGVLAASFVVHHPMLPGGRGGVAETLGMIGMFRAAIPDLSYRVEETVSTADRVGVRWTARGTHVNPLMGAPPSGRVVEVRGIDIFRVAEGRIAEAWVVSDAEKLMGAAGG